MAARKAASVLPLPVGATSSACWPAAIAAQPRACTSLGAAKAASNQAWVAGRNMAGRCECEYGCGCGCGCR
jgi:hypothetical protein